VFLIFVHLNKGIVVGDRSAHTATIHLPQLGYFAAFFTALTLPYAVKHIRDFLVGVKQNYGKVVLMLLEFRYFILPYILIRAQIKPTCWKSLAIETVMMVLVNIVTIYLFLFKPFHWEQEPDRLQRFMW